MSRIPALTPTEGKAHDILATVHRSLGVTPNLFRVAANAPAALEGLVGLNGALSRGSLRPAVREAIALAVAQANGCDYCLSAHTAAILAFAHSVTQRRGRVDADALGALRNTGVSDGETIEIVAHVALNVLTNYINLVADTDIDFPVVRAT
jgi:AhpD family alkylhydroperoxidase